MSASSDSEDYSSRVLSQNKKNDENFMSCKNNFIKDFQNRSHIPNVAQKSFSEANESLVNNTDKRKREHLDESEKHLNSNEVHKKKKLHHSNGENLEENDHRDFVTVRGDSKKKSKKKNHTIAADELDGLNFESEGSKKKHKEKKVRSLPDGLNSLEGESVVNEQEEAAAYKKHKKSKKRSKIESEAVYQSSQDTVKKEDTIITSTQVDKSSLPVQELHEANQSLLDFEQKNLSIENIGSELSEDEFQIEKLIEEAKLHLQSPSTKQHKKKSKKSRLESENSTKIDKLKKVDDPAHILNTFEKSNSSLKKVKFESDSLHNLKENHPCFILKVPVGLDPNQLIGNKISLHKKKKIKIGDNEYGTSPRESEVNLFVFGENNRQLRLEVSRIVSMKSNSKAEVLANRENELLDDLISEQVMAVGSNKNENQAKLEKSPTKNVRNNVDRLDSFLKDGAKFLEDVKYVSFKFKNEKLIADLEKQTNLVLKKQIAFLQEQNTSTAEYKKTKKELEGQTRELLQKRVNIMKNKIGGSDGELSDYF